MTVLSSLFKTVGEQEDEIIRILRRGADPGPVFTPASKFYFGDGSVVELDIIGKMDNRYRNNTNLTKIVFGTNCTSFADWAFNGCSNLSQVYCSDSMTYLAYQGFSSSGLSFIFISNSITTLNAYTFSNCPNLLQLTIPSTVTSINNDCFYNSSSIVATFENRTMNQVKAMSNFRWRLPTGHIICTDGTL